MSKIKEPKFTPEDMERDKDFMLAGLHESLFDARVDIHARSHTHTVVKWSDIEDIFKRRGWKKQPLF